MRRIPYLLAAAGLVLAAASPALAAAKYFGNRYVQHNPNAPDGVEGFTTFLGFLREQFPQSKSEIKRAFADGDYVIIIKIVEHWDVVQPIPEKAANNNTMF